MRGASGVWGGGGLNKRLTLPSGCVALALTLVIFNPLAVKVNLAQTITKEFSLKNEEAKKNQESAQILILKTTKVYFIFTHKKRLLIINFSSTAGTINY